jgi:hypothetical protein
LEMGSWALFSQAGLEPQFSRSQPPKQLGLQVWAACTQQFYSSCSLQRSLNIPLAPELTDPGPDVCLDCQLDHIKRHLGDL